MEIEVKNGEDILIVELSYNVAMENDGIGRYDYSGYTYYDHGTNYPVVENLTWDKTLYTDIENKLIDRHIELNIEDIEAKILINYDDDYTGED